MRPGGLTIVAGGAPSGHHLAALAAALAVIVDEGRVPADPLPAVYRSRWRRAALLEMTEVANGLKDDGVPWGGSR